MTIRLLIADNNSWVREGLHAAFHHTEIAVEGEATTSSEAIELALTCEFDVMLLDVKMPVFNGFDVLKAVRSKNTDLRVIIYSQHDRPDFWDRARQLAANGYVSKTSHKNQLIDVIRRVVQGECLWENEIMYSSPPIM